MERRGRGLIYVNIPGFSWRNCTKPRRTSFKITPGPSKYGARVQITGHSLAYVDLTKRSYEALINKIK